MSLGRVNFNKLKDNRGFGFIDALIGILLISIGIVAIIWAMTHNTKSVSFSNNYTKATYLAQSKLEELREYDGGTTAPTLPSNLTEGIFTVSYMVDNSIKDALPHVSPATETKITPVKVTVVWTENGQANSITMSAFYYSK